ncbi:MAG: flagellar biosynthesis anti-sigma factor FlgM [Deltaproteobacteria bacterium]|nr:flagellar biosynthesis anti-sigma factor FlgM [Deltaproteobacteria bacterium]
MKITPGTQSNLPAPDVTRKKSVARQPEEARPPAGKTDDAFSVKLSSAVEQMKATPTDEDEIRRDKVEAIRRQLASGTYNISGKDVANKILTALKG